MDIGLLRSNNRHRGSAGIGIIASDLDDCFVVRFPFIRDVVIKDVVFKLFFLCTYIDPRFRDVVQFYAC